MKRAVCPGTFDPMTNGHLDIIERAAGIFDEVIVAVALSPDKGGGPLFTIDERVEMVGEATAGLSNVSVRPFDSLLVDLARQVGATVIVKGLRAVTDFEREFQMAQLNYRIDDEIETMFIVAIPEYMYLSSSAVKEIAGHAGVVEGLVPRNVNERLVGRLRKGR
ncbi:MAG TPA: pantetheine-phosphate adenylyltransferase [Coriobacteriia bacterium]